MIDPTERRFVNTFVGANLRERCLSELGSPKKRGRFLDRLSHEYEDAFDGRYLEKIKFSKPNLDVEALEEILTANGAGKICHVISNLDELDGKDVNLPEALRQSLFDPEPWVLICTPSLAYFQAELFKGSRPRFLLRKR